MKPTSAYIFALALIATPALAASTPNLTGVWSIVDYKPSLKQENGQAPPLKPEAKAVYEKHRADAARGDKAYDETTICLPPGLPRLLAEKMPFQILQRPNAVYFVHQDNRVQWRAYFGEQLPADPDSLYLGDSVAKWDGPELTITSGDFLDSTLLDDSGLPHSDALRLTEHWMLGKDGKTLTARILIDDPKTFAHSWTTKLTFRKEPDSFKIPEDVCVDRLNLATTRPTLENRPHEK
jgi:hypothetical protein